MKKITPFFLGLLMALSFAFVAKAEDGAKKVDDQLAGYKSGFFLRSPDNAFRLNINGRLQTRVYYEHKGHDSNWTFSVRRARMDFVVTLKEKAWSKIAFEYSTKSAQFSTVNLYDAQAGYRFMREFQVTGGTVGLPLGFKPSSAGLLLLEPPLTTTQRDGGTALSPLRSSFGAPNGIGLELNGDIGKFFYDFSVINGAAEAKLATATTPASGGVESNYDLNFNKKISAGLRVGYNIMDPVPTIEMDLPYSEKPKLTVSIGGDYQGGRTDPYNSAVIRRIFTGALSGALRWRGLAINTEIFGRRTALDSLGTAPFGQLNLEDLGYYVNGGYFIVPNKFEIAAVGAQIFRQGPHNDSYQMGGGLNYYFHGNNAKIQAAYTMRASYNDVTSEAPIRTQYLGMQFSTSF